MDGGFACCRVRVGGAMQLYDVAIHSPGQRCSFFRSLTAFVIYTHPTPGGPMLHFHTNGVTWNMITDSKGRPFLIQRTTINSTSCVYFAGFILPWRGGIIRGSADGAEHFFDMEIPMCAPLNPLPRPIHSGVVDRLRSASVTSDLNLCFPFSPHPIRQRRCLHIKIKKDVLLIDTKI